MGHNPKLRHSKNSHSCLWGSEGVLQGGSFTVEMADGDVDTRVPPITPGMETWSQVSSREPGILHE